MTDAEKITLADALTSVLATLDGVLEIYQTTDGGYAADVTKHNGTMLVGNPHLYALNDALRAIAHD